MPYFRDQIGNEIVLNQKPLRVVSTVPSQTELVADLGAADQLVGLTSWCVHPKGLRETKTVIGGTKNLDIAKIKALKPDLIIANKEENLKEQIDILAQDFPVWVSDIRSIDQALEIIPAFGALLRKENKAEQMLAIAQKLRAELSNHQAKLKRFLYFIWKDPYMVAGHDTYISKLLEEVGLVNIAPKNEQRYPALSFSEIEELNADLILLSSEPYAFKSKDSKVFSPIVNKVMQVDGEFFTWYGSRIILSLSYLKTKPFSIK